MIATIPHHVAIIMDGNGRWAASRFMPRLAGHKRGLDALHTCVRHCGDRGVKVLTVFAFSSENWSRPPEEISGLLDLLANALKREIAPLHAQGVRLHFVGDRSRLSPKVQAGLADAEALTAANERLVFNICFNYSGRWDIAQAAARVAEEGRAITPDSLAGSLALAHVTDPDLLIRTGGEHRISNFLLWQAAYTELYFTDKLWPEFGPTDLDAALADFARRERRFGKTSEQVRVAQAAAQRQAA